jgi:hypothetical protein
MAFSPSLREENIPLAVFIECLLFANSNSNQGAKADLVEVGLDERLR